VRKCNPAQAQGARVHTQAWQPISESGWLCLGSRIKGSDYA
jgi:hypothetical protein